MVCVYKVQIVQADNLGIITVTPNNVIVNDHLDCERIGGVMASVVDCRLELRSSQIKDYKIDI